MKVGGRWVGWYDSLSQLDTFIKQDSVCVCGENEHASCSISNHGLIRKKNKLVEVRCRWCNPETPVSQTPWLSLYTYFQTNAIVKGVEKRSSQVKRTSQEMGQKGEGGLMGWKTLDHHSVFIEKNEWINWKRWHSWRSSRQWDIIDF